MSTAIYPLTPITGPFGGGSNKAGFMDMSHWANDTFDGTAEEADWLKTANTGSNTTALVNGQLVMTLQATSNADNQIQRNHANFTPATNFDIFFEARFKINDADKVQWVVGMHNIDTDVTNTADVGAFFEVNAADGNIDVSTGQSSVTTTDTLKDLVDNVFISIGIKILGTSKVEFYHNGILINTHTANMPTDALSPTFALTTTDSAADIMTVDWFRASRQESDSL